MKKRVINTLSILLNLLAISCSGQAEKTILLKSTQELNSFCSTDKVYDLIEIDSLLYNHIIKSIPNVFSTFQLSVKSKNVGVYQIGNVGMCIDCTRTTYFFIVYQKQILLFSNNKDIKSPQKELDRLESKGIIDADEKTILISKLKDIIMVNKSEEASRKERRW